MSPKTLLTLVILFDVAVLVGLAVGAWLMWRRREPPQWAIVGPLYIASTLLVAATIPALVTAAKSSRRREIAITHYYAGIDRLKRGDIEAAERELKKARDLDPGDPRLKGEIQERLAQIEEGPRTGDKKTTQLAPQVGTGGASGETPSGNTPLSPGNAPGNTPAVNTPPAGNGPAPPAGNALANSPPANPGARENVRRVHLPSDFRIEDYRLRVSLDPKKHSLKGEATVKVRAHDRAVEHLKFSLANDFVVDAVTLDGRSAAFRKVNDLLGVDAPEPVTRDEPRAITIIYHRNGTSPSLPTSGDRLAEDGIFLRTEGRWYPATGELDFRAPVHVQVTVPKGWNAVSAGALIREEKRGGWTTFTWQTKRPAAMIPVVANRYVQKSRQVGRVKVTCYAYPRHADRAGVFLNEAARILAFYQPVFGPYPYEKLAICEISHFPGGYGSTSVLMITDGAFEDARFPTALRKRLVRFEKAARGEVARFVAHEVGHQWWGNNVFPQGPGLAWLSEAFAEYGSYMYYEHAYGGRKALLKTINGAAEAYRNVVVRGIVDEPIAENDPYDQRPGYHETIYQKGALVLHSLRGIMGDQRFRRLLREFNQRYAGKTATIPDFERMAAEMHGQPLGWFFDQWLRRPGLMELRYAFTSDKDLSGRYTGAVVLAQKAPAWKMPVTLKLQVGNDIQERKITIEGTKQQIPLTLPGPLRAVEFDPKGWTPMMPPTWEPELAR
jgi:aminopeptidase N